MESNKDFLYHAAGGGAGDVSAGANLTDNAIVRGDGGVKGVQDSGWLISDADLMSCASGQLDLAYSGAADAVNITLDGTEAAAQALTIDESAYARTDSLVEITRSSSASGLSAHTVHLIHGAGGAALAVEGAGRFGISVTITGSDTSTYGIDVSENAGVVRTNALLYLTRSADSTAPVIEVAKGGSSAVFRTDRGGKIDLSGDGGEYIVSDADNQINIYIGGSEALQLGSTAHYSFENLRPNTSNTRHLGGNLWTWASLWTYYISQHEQAAAPSNTATFGTTWIKTATPCQWWYTDDAGNDVMGLYSDGTDTFLAAGVTNADLVLKPNGTGDVRVDSRGVKIDLSGDGGEYIKSNADNSLDFYAADDRKWAIQNTGRLLPISNNSVGSNVYYCNGVFSESLYLHEAGSADGDYVAFGQLWVKSDTPNILMFTDDAGTDFTVDVTAV